MSGELGTIFAAVMEPMTFLLLVVGVVFGIIGGAMPGISPSMTIVLLLPATMYMKTIPALLMLLGAYQGAMYGGSVSAILINTPGTASAAATAFDGYPMAQKGQAGKALQMSLYASCTGGAVAVLILIFSAKLFADLALKFGPAEYFGLMIFSLTLIAGVAGKSLLKGLISAVIGLILATVGMDPIYGGERFTFENMNLMDGVSMLSVFIGVFALSEIMMQLEKTPLELDSKPELQKLSDNKLSFAEYWSQKYNMLISGIIGCIIGALPGLGGSTASFMAYAESKRRSKYPEKYGTGIIDGVAASESANNGVCGGALIPMLALGIPGDVVTAILISAFIAHGLKPGPLLFVERIGEVYALYAGSLIAIIMLAIIGTLGNRYFAKIIQVRPSQLFSVVLVTCVVGTYASRGNTFDCMLMIIFGFLGYILRKYKYPLPALIIAFILGSPVETSLRQALRLSNNDISIFFTRPISAFLIIATIISVIYLIRRNNKDNKAAEAK